MATPVSPTMRAIILTALRVEYVAVRAHLSNFQEHVHPQGTIYERGIFSTPHGRWEVIIAEIGAGGTSAAMEAERAITYFQPSHLFFVGVAGGLKDVKLGDVVAATKVYGYESGKAEEGFFPRPDVGTSTYRMVQRARSEARKPDWLQRIIGPASSLTPNVLVAPIAAGEKVLKSTQSSLAKFLQSNYGDAVAVEMESHGILQASHANAQVEAMIIRGISDLIDNKTEVDAQGWQDTAARFASAFAFEILGKLAAAELSQNTLAHATVDTAQAQSSIPQPARKTGDSSTSERTVDSFEIFYSYAEEDERYAKLLQTHLILLKRQKLINDWYADKITGGRITSKELMNHLNAAHIILLLISPYYLASEHYAELERAMERHRANEARVIPIIVRPTTGWQDEPFGELQAIPRKEKPISQWNNLDEAFAEVAAEVRAVVGELKKRL